MLGNAFLQELVLIIRPGWPDWAKIRPRGLLSAVFLIAQVGGQHFWATFLHGRDNAIILTKSVFVYILGDFFTNSSGHPEIDMHACIVPMLLLMPF
jgi:hypothetical protein